MSLANGGFEQHHRQESEGIKPEIGIIGWRFERAKVNVPDESWQAGH
jgi:hypothetical protein